MSLIISSMFTKTGSLTPSLGYFEARSFLKGYSPIPYRPRATRAAKNPSILNRISHHQIQRHLLPSLESLEGTVQRLRLVCGEKMDADRF